jgi:hypothetical protein
MGLFSAHRRGFRPATIRVPIRLHSELSVAASVRRAGRSLRATATAATNDARVVGVLLVLAAAALGFEMAASFR